MIAPRSSHWRAPLGLISLGLLLALEPRAVAEAPPTPPADLAASDLGQGLRYFRAHRLPGDLPTPNEATGALVLDLRFSTSQADGAEALAAWLKFRTSPASPTFVLCNGEADAAIRDALLSVKDAPGLLTIGPTADHFAVDIELEVTADEDRAAYRAFDAGTTLSQLLVENTDKVRNDEAALAHERTPSVAPDEAAEPAAESNDAKPNSPPPPIDRVLQRAVHLHRGLIALKRMPSGPTSPR